MYYCCDKSSEVIKHNIFYSRNSKATGHRPVASESLKEPTTQPNKQTDGWGLSRPNEPGSLRAGNQEYAFIYRTWPSLKATAFNHNPTTVTPASTWNTVVMRKLHPRRQSAWTTWWGHIGSLKLAIVGSINITEISKCKPGLDIILPRIGVGKLWGRGLAGCVCKVFWDTATSTCFHVVFGPEAENTYFLGLYKKVCWFFSRCQV